MIGPRVCAAPQPWVLGLGEAVDERDQADGREDRAREIDVLAAAVTVYVVDEGERAGETDGRDREVHEHREAPVEVLGQRPAEDEADRPAGRGDGPVDAEGLRPLARLGEGKRDQREARRDQQGAEGPL